MMRSASEDGRLQVTAGASLLVMSRLVNWNADQTRFVSTSQHAFECGLNGFDPVFGRLACWLNLSVGAEFLAKGVCLARGIEFRSEHELPAYPSGDLQAWAHRFVKDRKCQGTLTATNFGPLAALTNGTHAPFKQLYDAVGATPDQKNFVTAGYDFLCRTIRNRDAHAFVPNVRDSHFFLVAELFAPCFNLLVAWLPGGSATLNTWCAEAGSFIRSL